MYAFRPEPEPGEREALVRALELVISEEARATPYRSEWRRAGLEQHDLPDDEDEPWG